MASIHGVNDFDAESIIRLDDANRRIPLQTDRRRSAFNKNPNVREEIITNNPVNVSYTLKKKSVKATAPDSFVPERSSLLKDLLTKELPQQHERKKDFIPPASTIRQEPSEPLATITVSSATSSSDDEAKVNGKKRFNPEDYKTSASHKRLKGQSGYRSGVVEQKAQSQERPFDK